MRGVVDYNSLYLQNQLPSTDAEQRQGATKMIATPFAVVNGNKQH
jgi:hypothetical protein